MNLHDALRQIARDGDLNADELIAFAAEDTVGGRDTGDWDGMSTFEAEGQILYALIRAMRPERVVEIGVDSGGTSTHILAALDANDMGQLYSVDIKAEVGSKVPDSLRSRWTLVQGDGLTVDLPDHADFCFEDGDHSYQFTHDMLVRLKALKPRVIMSHDYYTHEVYGGFFVKQAFDEVLPDGMGIKIDGAFSGLGLWFNPDWSGEPDLDDEVIEVWEVLQSVPTRKPSAKRKAAKK
jgi:hypothetical protein